MRLRDSRHVPRRAQVRSCPPGSLTSRVGLPLRQERRERSPGLQPTLCTHLGSKQDFPPRRGTGVKPGVSTPGMAGPTYTEVPKGRRHFRRPSGRRAAAARACLRPFGTPGGRWGILFLALKRQALCLCPYGADTPSKDVCKRVDFSPGSRRRDPPAPANRPASPRQRPEPASRSPPVAGGLFRSAVQQPAPDVRRRHRPSIRHRRPSVHRARRRAQRDPEGFAAFLPAARSFRHAAAFSTTSRA